MDLQIGDIAKRRLARLHKKTEAPTDEEVIRRALLIYESLHDKSRSGAALVLCEAKGIERELLVF